MSKYIVTTPAATSYVPVSELQTHLLLFGDSSYDSELQDILLAAEEYLADFMGEYLVDTGIRVNICDFGSDAVLPHKFYTGIAVMYWDSNNSAQTLSTSDYIVDLSGEYPVLKVTTAPTDVSTVLDCAGYMTYTTYMSYVPAKLNRAVLLIAAEMFNNRTESSVKKMEKVHLTAMRLIQSLRGF